MKIAAFDLSKTSAGWAAWGSDLERPIHGSKALGHGNLTPPGLVFARVHGLMNDVHMMTGFTVAYIEEPLQPAAVQAHTTFDTLLLLYGLYAHALSFCEAKGIRAQSPNQTTWRRHFIGKMKRGTKTPDLKAYTMERCRQLGMAPKNNDEGDALGILDWGCEVERITPPWRANEVLRPMLEGRT